ESTDLRSSPYTAASDPPLQDGCDWPTLFARGHTLVNGGQAASWPRRHRWRVQDNRPSPPSYAAVRRADRHPEIQLRPSEIGSSGRARVGKAHAGIGWYGPIALLLQNRSRLRMR